MSQAGSLNGTGGGGGTSNIQNINVQTGTSPVVTANNTITFNGAVVAAGTNPVRTDGTAPATMALEVQTSQAIASTDATKIGLAAFNSADFTVDANGFVSSTGSVGVVSITGDSGGSVTGAVTLTGGTSGAVFTGTAGTTLTESFDFLALPNSTVTPTGYISFGGTRYISNFGTNNIFAGPDAGNLTNTAAGSVGLGFHALMGLTSGDDNIAIGPSSLAANTAGRDNVSVGSLSMVSNLTGNFNTAVGEGSLGGLTGGDNNIALGVSSLNSLDTGSNNISIGANSGTAYTTTESSNITIGNAGVIADANAIRIGTTGSGTGQQNTCYVAGVAGVSVSNTNMVTIDTTTGQMGSQAVPGGGGITTINGDTGSISGATVTVFSNNATQNAGSSVLFANSGTTSTLNVTDANLNTIIGRLGGNGTLSGTNNTSIGYLNLISLTSGNNNTIFGSGSGTSIDSASNNTCIGQNSLGAGTGANNTAVGKDSLANVASGTDNSVLGYRAGDALHSGNSSNILIGSRGVNGDNNIIRIGSQGSTAGLQNSCFIAGITGVTTSNSNFVTIDTTTGQLGATASAGSGVTTIDGDTGSATGATITFDAQTNAGSSVSFAASGSTVEFNTCDADGNLIMGFGAGNGTLSGASNTCVGQSTATALTSGNANVAIGNSSLQALQSGAFNCAIGTSAGVNYTTSESGNICINNPGTVGESNVLRIGTPASGTQDLTSAFISGIAGVTVSNTAAVLIDTTTGQLGTVISSLRYKHSVQDMKSCSEEFMKLRPVSFVYKSDVNMQWQYGLIAEEVEEVMPNLVVYDKEGRPDSVKYHELPIFLLAEIQKLRKEINELKGIT